MNINIAWFFFIVFKKMYGVIVTDCGVRFDWWSSGIWVTGCVTGLIGCSIWVTGCGIRVSRIVVSDLTGSGIWVTGCVTGLIGCSIWVTSCGIRVPRIVVSEFTGCDIRLTGCGTRLTGCYTKWTGYGIWVTIQFGRYTQFLFSTYWVN